MRQGSPDSRCYSLPNTEFANREMVLNAPNYLLAKPASSPCDASKSPCAPSIK